MRTGCAVPVEIVRALSFRTPSRLCRAWVRRVLFGTGDSWTVACGASVSATATCASSGSRFLLRLSEPERELDQACGARSSVVAATGGREGRGARSNGGERQQREVRSFYIFLFTVEDTARVRVRPFRVHAGLLRVLAAARATGSVLPPAHLARARRSDAGVKRFRST